MIQMIVLAILTVSLTSFADSQEPKFSPWLPSLQLNLYNEIQKIEDSRTESKADIEKENLKVIKQLNAKSTKVFKRKQYITYNQAEELLQQLHDNPVTDLENSLTYDPESKYGFCFGRATAVWLNALEAGIDKDSIKKIFLMGPMKTSGIDWQFHVVTAIRSKDNFSERWLVIYPNLDYPVTVQEFYKFFKKFNSNGRLRVVVSEPQRLVPSSTEKFGPMDYKNIENDYLYNKYFQDLLSQFSSKANLKRTNLCKYLF